MKRVISAEQLESSFPKEHDAFVSLIEAEDGMDADSERFTFHLDLDEDGPRAARGRRLQASAVVT